MKKICAGLLMGLVCLLFSTGTDAQVKSYQFSQSSGTYTPVTAPVTVHASGWDDAVVTVVIPFTFTFNGIGYTGCKVNSNGYITFGATASSGTGYTPISSGTGYAGAVAAFARDLISNASIVVSSTEGTAPNRAFVIQWNNAQRYSGGAIAGDVLNFQIRLNETTNTIDVVYGTCTATSATSLTNQTGLRGAANTDFSDRLSATNWSATNLGTANSSTLTSLNTIMPSAGLTFTWTPAACSIPSAILVPAGTITSTSAVINWTAAGPAPANGYDWKVTAPGAGSEGAVVVSGSVAAGIVTATATGLTQGTAYSAYVRSNCGGTNGSWTGPTNFTTTALCAVPTALATNTVTTTSANVTWTGAGTFILEYGLTGFTPGTGAAAGAGGTIITGAVSPQALTGLTPSTGYDVYVRNDCTGAGNGYSANSTKTSFTTLTPPPANDNCASATVIGAFPYTFNQTDGAAATQTAFVSACASGMNDGVWYQFTGTGCSQTFTVTPTGWDPEIGVYTGSCGTFTCVTSADAGGSGTAEMVTFVATAGVVYYINIGHFSGSTNSPEGPFTINGTQNCCVAPAAVSSNTVTFNSANITWTGSGTFILEYGLAGFTPGTGAAAGAGGTVISGAVSPQALIGLTTGTSYDVYVRQDCTGSGTGYSINTIKYNFSTSLDCSLATVIACGSSVTTGNLAVAGTAYNPVATTCGFSTPGKEILYSFTSTTAGTYTLNVTNVNGGAGYIDYFFKDASLGCANTGWTCIGDINSVTTKTFTLAAATTYFIMGDAESAASTANHTFRIDCPASCAAPTAVSNNTVTSTTANITWTGAGTFILEYGLTGFTPGTGAAAGAGGTIIAGAVSPQTLTGLTGGTGYDVYVRNDCTGAGNGYSLNGTKTSFTTTTPPPSNDNATGAITITLGAGCATGNIYTNVAATQSVGEPFASCYESAGTHTVWYQFTAPASGNVKVSTDFTGGTLSDTHVAVFSASDVTDYTTFSIISCDDDNGVTGNTKSILYATGLTPGQTYYLSVDGFLSSTGTFCIAVDELAAAMLSTTNTCGSSYQTPSGSIASYTGQVPLVDAGGNLVAMVRNPAGGAVNAYTAGQNINTGAVRQDTYGVYYLDRNFRIRNTTATNVEVQLFFLPSEMTLLNAADAYGSVAPSTLQVTKQTETVSNCYDNYLLANGVNSEIIPSAAGVANGVDWVKFTTPSFSNFFLHRITTVLPVSIEYMRGSKVAGANYLQWKVNCTSAASVVLSLERSSDGRNFKSIQDQTATSTRCLQEFNYTDISPLPGINYYRLKTVSPDGKISFSSIVALIGNDKSFELISVAPNPVQNNTVLTVSTVKSGMMTISVSDVAGRIIKKQNVSVIAGSNAVNFDFSSLAAGTYHLTAIDAGGEKKTIDFVKF